MEIKWHDIDPQTEQKRYLCAERFAGEWSFRLKLTRRGDWTRWVGIACIVLTALAAYFSDWSFHGPGLLDWPPVAVIITVAFVALAAMTADLWRLMRPAAGVTLPVQDLR